MVRGSKRQVNPWQIERRGKHSKSMLPNTELSVAIKYWQSGWSELCWKCKIQTKFQRYSIYCLHVEIIILYICININFKINFTLFFSHCFLIISIATRKLNIIFVACITFLLDSIVLTDKHLPIYITYISSHTSILLIQSLRMC